MFLFFCMLIFRYVWRCYFIDLSKSKKFLQFSFETLWQNNQQNQKVVKEKLYLFFFDVPVYNYALGPAACDVRISSRSLQTNGGGGGHLAGRVIPVGFLSSRCDIHHTNSHLKNKALPKITTIKYDTIFTPFCVVWFTIDLVFNG